MGPPPRPPPCQGRPSAVRAVRAFVAAAAALSAAPPGAGPAAVAPIVVLDPGHGGPNAGAVAGGLVEKEVTLDMARRVRAHLEETTDLRVVLTREDDVHIPLRDRARIANQLGAALLIAIHGNASPAPGPRGYEAWFVSPDGTRLPAHVEETREALPPALAPVSAPVEAILGDLVSQNAQAGGARLAADVVRAIGDAVSPAMPSRGVKQAAYTVLVSAAMPAAVVELGFLNHPEEGPLLADPAHRGRLARGIAEGIRAFLASGPPAGAFGAASPYDPGAVR